VAEDAPEPAEIRQGQAINFDLPGSPPTRKAWRETRSTVPCFLVTSPTVCVTSMVADRAFWQRSHTGFAVWNERDLDGKELRGKHGGGKLAAILENYEKGKGQPGRVGAHTSGYVLLRPRLRPEPKADESLPPYEAYMVRKER